MDPIITGALISGGAGLLNNLLGGSKSKGSQTTVPTPGKWDPDSKKIWDATLAKIFGDSTTPTLENRMSADDQFQRNAYQDFFNKSGASTQGYLNQLSNAAQTYLQNPVSGSIGGQGVKFIPKSSSRSFGDVSGYLEKALGAEDVYNTRVLNFNQEFTPYRAQQKYLDYLLPMAREFNAQRWGQTSSADYSPSLLNDIGTGIKALAPAFQEVFNKKPEENIVDTLMRGTLGGYS